MNILSRDLPSRPKLDEKIIKESYRTTPAPAMNLENLQPLVRMHYRKGINLMIYELFGGVEEGYRYV